MVGSSSSVQREHDADNTAALQSWENLGEGSLCTAHPSEACNHVENGQTPVTNSTHDG